MCGIHRFNRIAAAAAFSVLMMIAYLPREAVNTAHGAAAVGGGVEHVHQAAAFADPVTPGALEEQINHWRDSLARQPEFNSWTSASYRIQTLGPGTHAWLVTFENQGKAAGYMVVNGDEKGGYSLGEYGAGKHPPLLFPAAGAEAEERGCSVCEKNNAVFESLYRCMARSQLGWRNCLLRMPGRPNYCL